MEVYFLHNTNIHSKWTVVKLKLIVKCKQQPQDSKNRAKRYV